MTLNRWQHAMPALLLTLSVWSAVGCDSRPQVVLPPHPPIIPHAPDAVTLYAIDGPEMEGEEFDLGTGHGPYDPLADYTPDELFHGYPILGHVNLTGTPEGAHLARLIEQARDRRQGLIAGCFVPRHGLRVIRGGVTVDYVICFECDQFHWFIDAQSRAAGVQYFPPTHDDAFTAPLTAAGIELAE
ncbi:MAG: hypothetical protein AAGA29_09205 [Planctomycetota bacterium]